MIKIFIESGENQAIRNGKKTTNEQNFVEEFIAHHFPTLQKGIDFELFLWPNNHDDGDFESLLLQMINPAHRCLLDCFEGFEKCVGGSDPNGTIYKTPDRKSAIYTYINSFIKSQSEEKKMKSGYWFFNDPRYWDLNADAGKPLLEFLRKHL